jgi:hypothetical protein
MRFWRGTPEAPGAEQVAPLFAEPPWNCHPTRVLRVQVQRLPGWMAQSAVVRDYRQLEIERRQANRLVLTVTG